MSSHADNAVLIMNIYAIGGYTEAEPLLASPSTRHLNQTLSPLQPIESVY